MRSLTYFIICLLVVLLVAWASFTLADVQKIFVLKEIDDDHIIIVTELGEKLLLEKWSLRFSPLLFEGKSFVADVSSMWVTIYFEERDPIKWSIEKSLGYTDTKPLSKKKVPTDTPAQYLGVGSGHWIQEVLGNGKFIVLEDDSLWEVSALDEITSAIWLPISEIAVIKAGGPYPYMLVNTDDGEKVEARYLGQK